MVFCLYLALNFSNNSLAFLMLLLLMGIIQTPALAIDGKVVFLGFVPDVKTIKNKIKEKSR